MEDLTRNDYMLVSIDPAFRDERIGPLAIDRLILSTRFEPYSLYPISEWPSHVYVARVVDPSILKTQRFTKEQVELIAWGTLFQTLENARDFASNGSLEQTNSCD